MQNFLNIYQNHTYTSEYDFLKVYWTFFKIALFKIVAYSLKGYFLQRVFFSKVSLNICH